MEFYEDTTVAGTGTPEPTDSGLIRPQSISTEPDPHHSELATKLFVSKDPKKQKRLKIADLERMRRKT